MYSEDLANLADYLIAYESVRCCYFKIVIVLQKLTKLQAEQKPCIARAAFVQSDSVSGSRYDLVAAEQTQTSACEVT